MSKKNYIEPSISEISLDETSVMLVTSQEPPTSGSETDGDNEDGDDTVEPITLGVSGTESIWNQTKPF